MVKPWAYFNDLCGCKITAVYRQNNLLEIEYFKGTQLKSLTLNFHVGGGSMGYVECFKYDSIPLPPAKAQHSLSGTMGIVQAINLYVQSDEHTRLEELEIVCEEGSYLCYFSEDETEKEYAKIEKNRAPQYPKVLHEAASLPKELFSVDLFKENLAFALRAHGKQKTPHGLPYSMHLLSVAIEVMNALSIEPLSYDEHNVALACALLHDVNEDTDTKITKETFFSDYAEVIIKGVSALSKDKMLPKEMQMRDSLERLKKRQKCVGLVKLADRITNLGIPPKHWNEAKRRHYRLEAEAILEALGHTHHYLAQKLKQKILAYQ